MTNNALVLVNKICFGLMVSASLLAGCVTADELLADDGSGDVTGDVGSDVAARTFELRNKDLLHRYHVEVWDEGRLDQAWKYLGEGFTSHATVTTMPSGQYPGPDFLAQFWAGFPDLRSHEDALIGDGDLVTIRWTITGTHTGPFFGVADGKLVEHWGGVADQMDDFLAQIGALPR